MVEKPFQRLIKEKRLMAHHHRGFWQSMDTFKDKMLLDDLESQGKTYWEVWKESGREINELV